MTKILMIAGEASGDTQGALLINALRKKTPHLRIIGMGGDKMKEQGMELLYHIDDIAVLGIWEVLKHLHKIKRIMDAITDKAVKEKVDGAVLIDYPGFNLKLAARLKKAEIPVYYYICPQVWAWGRKRVHKMKKLIDYQFVILPFEKDFYANYGIESDFIGHPLIDYLKKDYNIREYKEKYGISPGNKIINIQPGSRAHEVEKILPVMLQLVKHYNSQRELTFILPQASTISKSTWNTFHLEQYENLTVIRNRDYYTSLKAADFVVTASGTSTIEAAIFEKPLILLYAVNPVTYYLGKLLIKLPHIGLVNIVAGRTIIPELIQKEMTQENLRKTFEDFFFNEENYTRVKKELKIVRDKLGVPGAAQRAAERINGFLQNKK